MPAIPRQQCMVCGLFRSVEELTTQVSFPDPLNKVKKHVTVICSTCKNETPKDSAAMPPSRK